MLPAPGTAVEENEQLNLLRLLHSEATSDLRAKFIPELMNEISETNAPVIVHAILALGSLEDMAGLLRDSKRMTIGIRNSIWWALLERLVMEPHRFNDADLNTLEAMAREDRKYLEGFLRARCGSGGMGVRP